MCYMHLEKLMLHTLTNSSLTGIQNHTQDDLNTNKQTIMIVNKHQQQSTCILQNY